MRQLNGNRPIFPLAYGMLPVAPVKAFRLLAVAVALATASMQISAARAESDAPAVNVFQMPKAQKALIAIAASLRTGNYETAKTATQKALDQYPGLPFPNFVAAFLAARDGDGESALRYLDDAVDAGYRDLPSVDQNAAFDIVRDDPRFQDALARMRDGAASEIEALGQPKTAPVRDGIALVDEESTAWEPRLNLLRAGFTFNSKAFAARIVDAGKKDPARALLNDWYRSGDAAGNVGDLYDNRDRKHSRLNPKTLPQVTYVQYGDSAKAEGLDFGFNSLFFYNAPTFGNSSVGVKGLYSVARFALGNAREAAILYLQYRANQLYIYPSVRDHAPFALDRFPANTPYLLISRGKSGSDKPFMRAVANIMAAFKPAVKEYLIAENLLMPTVQMVFRRGQAFVESDADYLSPSAHPTVFDGDQIDREKMVRLANALEIEDIPPMVSLNVIEESDISGAAFSASQKGILFDTPSAIARVVTTEGEEKRLTVSTAHTAGAGEDGVKFHWVVLEGDPGKVKITPKDAAATVAEITIPWHGRHQSLATPEIDSNRVDIGVFAQIGDSRFYSAPAFISVTNLRDDDG